MTLHHRLLAACGKTDLDPAAAISLIDDVILPAVRREFAVNPRAALEEIRWTIDALVSRPDQDPAYIVMPPRLAEDGSIIEPVDDDDPVPADM